MRGIVNPSTLACLPQTGWGAGVENHRMLTVDVADARVSGLCVVVLHGYAMKPEDLMPFARSMGVPGRYCFPRGPFDAELGGFAWWPVDEAARGAALAHGPRDLSQEHPAQREKARTALASLLQEASSQGAGRLVLAGFSQGGMLACDTLLHEDVHVDALALFSSSRIALDEWQARRHRLAGLPALVAHGKADVDLAFAAGRALHDWLVEAGAAARWAPFEGGHEMPLAVWRGFRRFLREISAPSTPFWGPPAAPCK
ncbi:MAG: hypothetical protein AB1430_01830 [Pseudomonadota bacterium]